MAGIYIHVPFCRAKCAYCDFYSVAIRSKVEQYVAAAVEELALRRHELAPHPVTTVYIGGGTPSYLDADSLTRLVSALNLADVEEFTIEVNPEDVNAAAASLWRRLGINRVSMGVQSLVDEELKQIRRRHSANDAIEAISILGQAGFSNISCDLIYGLPGQTPSTFEQSLNRLLDTNVTHLSAYLLSYEPGTLLTRRLQKGEIAEMEFDNVMECYRKLCSLTREAGFEHYEISNFALRGRESRHNSNYWNLTPYLGIGPAAHSLRADGTRVFHNANLNEWLKSPAHVEIDDENRDNFLNDLILISLRTARGLTAQHFSDAEWQPLLKAAQPFIVSHQLLYDNGCLRIPESEWLQSDAIMRELLFI